MSRVDRRVNESKPRVDRRVNNINVSVDRRKAPSKTRVDRRRKGSSSESSWTAIVVVSMFFIISGLAINGVFVKEISSSKYEELYENDKISKIDIESAKSDGKISLYEYRGLLRGHERLSAR